MTELSQKTATDFADFGKRSFGYVWRVRSDDMNARYPDKVELPEGLDLWGLFSADGQPLAVSDELGGVVQNAEELDLMPLARH